MVGGPHQEADVEDGLPHGPPVLHVPAVLSEPLRVRLPGVCPYQPGQQIAALELEVERLVSEVLEREVRRGVRIPPLAQSAVTEHRNFSLHLSWSPLNIIH